MIEQSKDKYKWLIRDESLFNDGLSKEPHRHDLIGLNHTETEHYRLLQELGGKDKIFIDVGAHVGYSAIRMTKYYNWVYAFEPEPFNYQGLLKNIDINEVRNITQVMMGLSDVSTLCEMT